MDKKNSYNESLLHDVHRVHLLVSNGAEPKDSLPNRDQSPHRILKNAVEGIKTFKTICSTHKLCEAPGPNEKFENLAEIVSGPATYWLDGPGLFCPGATIVEWAALQQCSPS